MGVLSTPRDIPTSLEEDVTGLQTPPDSRHPTDPRTGLCSWKDAIINLVSMRHPLPLFTIAATALLLTLIYTNYSAIMFSRLNKFKDKVHGLAEDVHDKLHTRDEHRPPPTHQQQTYPGQPPPIPPKPVTPEAYAILRRRWMDLVVGDFNKIDTSNKVIHDHIARQSWGMNRLLETYNPTETQVFNNCGPFCATTVHFKNTCGRLLSLAIAWATPGTAQYQNDDVLQKLIHGIDVVYEKFFVKMADDIKRCIQTRENWWNIQIGAPQNLADLGVILYDHLGEERRKRLGAKTVELAGNPFTPSLKGGNRSWVSRILVVTGIFTDNAETIRMGIRCMSADGGSENVRKNTLFGYIQPGDGEGLYKDGSLISHDVYPYAGGYGLIMLGSVARLFSLLNSPESPDAFKIRDPNTSIIYDSVERNFLPVVWQGIIFEHVRGRGIARREGPGWDNGHVLIHAVALLSQGSTPEMATHLSSYVRLWVESNPGDIFPKAEVPQIPIIQSILSNTSLPAAPIPRGCFSCPMQEHFAYHSPDDSWCFTISTSSTRIGRAEALNKENLKAWYQGDGMTYLYTTTQKTHYADDYWPTMDPLHAPGVTNHQTEPPSPAAYKCVGFKDWSGGACWAGGGAGNGVAYKSNGIGARFAAVSMDHLSFDKASAAKKSWFLFENGIIALGAGCTGTPSPPSLLHTTIESRNLDKPGRPLIINGEEYTQPPGWIKKSQWVHWAWLENTGGYIFLDAKDRNPREKIFTRTSNCGAWRDINDSAKPDECCKEYVNIIINHGVNPRDSAYAYAILPLATREGTEEVQANPPWKVLANTVGIQAVEYSFERGVITLATFWAPGEINGVRVEQACQLVWGYWGDEWCLTISDPSHKTAAVAVNLEVVGMKGLKVDRMDGGVEVDGGRVVFKGLKDGATKSVFFKGGHDEL
ncbi:hypothetical protein TWF281_004854 [Arthrobotrys megalospora]